MKQPEIDKLVDDIQEYLHEVAEKGAPAATQCAFPQTEAEAGIFIPAESRKRMRRFLKLSRYACYSVEALTIGLLTTVMLAPFESWTRTIMFITGVLVFAIFTVTSLMGLQARLRLLLTIESNTQRIAVSKARIARALHRIRPE